MFSEKAQALFPESTACFLEKCNIFPLKPYRPFHSVRRQEDGRPGRGKRNTLPYAHIL